MFGTRADGIVDFTFLVTLIAPGIAYASFRLARGRRHELHQRIQLGLLALCIVSVVALEVRIRLAGGSGALLAQSAWGDVKLARVLLGIHIVGAVATYGLWCWLAVKSFRRFRSELPGGFSRTHKRTGKLILAGLTFTTLSAAAMYSVAFVL